MKATSKEALLRARCEMLAAKLAVRTKERDTARAALREYEEAETLPVTLLGKWKWVIRETWLELTAAVTLTRWTDLFCWDCDTLWSVRVSRFERVARLLASYHLVRCPKCRSRLLWPHDMRRIRQGLATQQEAQNESP